MGLSYAEKERAFIASLDADTGLSLDGWMHAITESKVSGRNEIIDWLRHRGFTFARASWLERIHHNGGQLIYASGAGPHNKTRDQDLVEDLAALDEAPPVAPAPSIAPAPPTPDIDPQPIAALLAGAKGLRPLAEMILARLKQDISGLTMTPQPPFITLSAPKPFAALLPDPKALKIYADFGETPAVAIKSADGSHRKGLVPYPSMIEINDARRVDGVLIASIVAAQARANGDSSR